MTTVLLFLPFPLLFWAAHKRVWCSCFGRLTFLLRVSFLIVLRGWFGFFRFSAFIGWSGGGGFFFPPGTASSVIPGALVGICRPGFFFLQKFYFLYFYFFPPPSPVIFSFQVFPEFLCFGGLDFNGGSGPAGGEFILSCCFY